MLKKLLLDHRNKLAGLQDRVDNMVKVFYHIYQTVSASNTFPESEPATANVVEDSQQDSTADSGAGADEATTHIKVEKSDSEVQSIPSISISNSTILQRLQRVIDSFSTIPEDWIREACGVSPMDGLHLLSSTAMKEIASSSPQYDSNAGLGAPLSRQQSSFDAAASSVMPPSNTTTSLMGSHASASASGMLGGYHGAVAGGPLVPTHSLESSSTDVLELVSILGSVGENQSALQRPSSSHHVMDGFNDTSSNHVEISDVGYRDYGLIRQDGYDAFGMTPTSLQSRSQSQTRNARRAKSVSGRAVKEEDYSNLGGAGVTDSKKRRRSVQSRGSLQEDGASVEHPPNAHQHDHLALVRMASLPHPLSDEVGSPRRHGLRMHPLIYAYS